ncbi:hypothetical protein E3N88_42658 [Mikania micrantha]|uniref:AB hydrolase-1 domain-containing protein n=1 Tax=Mikania micrantha TaxID=192012 RepID=A0A5N6LH43_9ASTR|nr:hypothetical protein E3N88_42658 [Mikania micrantha]
MVRAMEPGAGSSSNHFLKLPATAFPPLISPPPASQHKTIQQVATLAEYSKPLRDFMNTIPPEEKVVLVGHSLGGMNVSLAMEKFPEKVAVGVFLTAFMPDSDQNFSYALDQLGSTLSQLGDPKQLSVLISSSDMMNCF